MFVPFRRRIRLPQLALLALFGLGLVLQPVLAAFGEAHERAAHAGSGSAVHADDLHADALYAHADAVPEAAPEETRGADGEEGRTLHQLLHFAHCCAQSPALHAPELASLPQAPASAIVTVFDDAPPPNRSSIAPYRPPIRA